MVYKCVSTLEEMRERTIARTAKDNCFSSFDRSGSQTIHAEFEELDETICRDSYAFVPSVKMTLDLKSGNALDAVGRLVV